MDNKECFFYIYLVIILLSVFTGIYRYAIFDKATRIIFWLLVITFITETLTRVWVLGKSPIYHFYSVFEIFMISLYFFITIKSVHYKLLVILCAIIYPLLEILDTYYLKNLKSLNYNFIIMEVFL